MARIRTLDFLPEIFQTNTNSQFLAATLDQVVSEPTTQKIQGFIGSKLGYGINALDRYVTESTKDRANYQLEPGVVFTKQNETSAQDFISYPGLIDAIKMQGGITDNNAALFKSQFYSWDSFTSLDKLVNYHEYYWLPDGPPAVTVSPSSVYTSGDYQVTNYSNAYGMTLNAEQASGPINPTITLLRGGNYTFNVDQSSSFWIQSAPGISGYDPVQPGVSTRDVFGVTNNGEDNGVVTFDVPLSSAQNDFIFANTTTVDVVSTLPFDQINGKLVHTYVDNITGQTYQGVDTIDGISVTDGMRILFYNTGIPGETGFVSANYNETNYDVNAPYFSDPKTITIQSTNSIGNYLTIASGHTTAELSVNQTITFSGLIIGGLSEGQIYFVKDIIDSTRFTISQQMQGNTFSVFSETGTMTANINQGQYQQGFETIVSETFYKVQLVGTSTNPVIRLLPDGTIPVNENIVPTFGKTWINRAFYRNQLDVISLVPHITANLDVLYYQDGTNPNKLGIIKLVDTSADNFINIPDEILGKPNYTSPTGVKFTNGLKVIFQGNVYPATYKETEFYVEGVGTAIELIPVSELIATEKFSIGVYNPWGTGGFDDENFDISLNVPVDQDYITIARNSINKNAWSRSNRWFHVDVINDTAKYNRNPDIVTQFATFDNKAKRPIIEFYPNLKLFNSGTVGKNLVDFIDTRTSDALSNVAGLHNYYPDVEVSTLATATIVGVVSATSTTIVVPTADITGTFQIGMYVSDFMNVIPRNAQIDNIVQAGGITTLSISWSGNKTVLTTTATVVGTDSQVDNYAVFPGARITFANDSNPDVRNKIYVVNFIEDTTARIALALAEDSSPLPDEMINISRGYTNQGKSFYYDGSTWIQAQQKYTVNQPPLFDIFDKNGASFGDTDVYPSTSFTGNTLFAYGIGVGADDPVLGFPIRYSSLSNIGDIQFEITLNSQQFNYVKNGNSITQSVNTGYVHDFNSYSSFDRLIGWKTAIAPSTQYQVFNFDFDPAQPAASVVCDVPAKIYETGTNNWPSIQVFVNNVYLEDTEYSTTISENSTTIVLNVLPVTETVIQVLVLSDSVSANAYFTIPVNLSNNPFNQDITMANLGDIRMQYSDIFVNAPNTYGDVFGINNFRDCGNLVQYGTKIIQNSASLAIASAFLRKQDNSLSDALLFNSREYVKYKQLLIDTVQNSDYTRHYTAANILDDAIDQISASRSEVNAFFWTDMLPAMSPYRTSKYTFNSTLDITRYPVSRVYDFTSANYFGILVYLTRVIDNVTFTFQLLKDVDYTVSSESPTITVTRDLQPGDTITINEYNQTYGSYVPYTPSKLGLYRLFQPAVVLDVNYSQPTYFILGHDGSFTRLYGDYDDTTDTLSDYRDQVLLEFEKRIYNNCKLGTDVPVSVYEMLPGFFRNTTSWEEWIEMYSPAFLDWVGQNRIDYKTQYYQRNNEWTYNYTNSTNILDGSQIKQGNWRGVYEYFYDTSTPNTTPWEMLGFSNIPSWWSDRYGPAPYTSDNEVLWNDLEEGFVWNNGNSYIMAEFARPGLSKIIPVNSNGDLIDPIRSVVGNYNPSTFQKDWKVGDLGPAEFSYRRSSSYPFDIIRIIALTRPAAFYALGIDLDNYRYNTEFNQYLVNDRSHLVISDVEIYGAGTPKTSYINWIVDFQKQLGIDATTSITSLLNNLDVRLVYRLGGFSDKTLLNFYAEKSSPNDTNSALLIPDESYSVLLYENQPFDRLSFTSIVVQQNSDGWSVYGNSQNFAYFTVRKPSNNTKYQNITVGTSTVKVAVDYGDTEILVPYGTKFYSTQELAQFIMGYSAYLSAKGMKFNQIEAGTEINWALMIQEILYWSQTGWETGSIVTLNPAATDIMIDKSGCIVQPMTLRNQNFVLNQDLYPIQLSDLCINRDETRFHVHTLNQGDSLSYAQFNLGNIEHGIVFDNVTLFNDTLYDLVTGLRQNRISVRGSKTAEWNGTVNAWGFILNQDNIQEWSKNVKYPKGIIVKHKNKYWTAMTTVEPSAAFDEQQWKPVRYQDIQKGMLPNSASRSYESTLYYNTSEANLEQDADLLSFSLIGYRPRDYLAIADLTDITQVNVYQNLIKTKGTRNATNAFKGANLPQGGIDYNVYENWAIKVGEYGGVLNENFVEFRLDQNVLTGNPSIVSLTTGKSTPGSMQEIPLTDLYNYSRPVSSANILSVLNSSTSDILYPSAGYVNFDDVRMSSFYYSGLTTAVNSAGDIVPISDFYARDYAWVANFKEKWNVFAWKSIGEIVNVRPNLNGTCTVTFSSFHNLDKLDPISIVNFASNIDGYYIVSDVVSLTEILINLTIPNNSGTEIQGRGIGLTFKSQRVKSPSAIPTVDLLDSEFTKNTVWVDENTDGNWAVYRKSINYNLTDNLSHDNSIAFGTSVAYSENAGYLVSDPGVGRVYRYQFNPLFNSYDLTQTLVPTIDPPSTFGTAISCAGSTVAISHPTSAVYVYVQNDSVVSSDMVQCQKIQIPAGVSQWGDAIRLSADGNWLYISAIDDAAIYAYHKQQIHLASGYFVTGNTYIIDSLGSTDFTSIGAIENKVGITFVATGPGTGTGTATQINYVFANIIDGSATYSSADNFGHAISTNHDGSILVVGVPDRDGTFTDWGNAVIYQRTVQKFEATNDGNVGSPQFFDLAWTPTTLSKTVTSTNSSGNIITLNNTTGLNVNDPIMFYGSDLQDTNIGGYVVYYIRSIAGNNITLKTSLSTTTPVTIQTKASVPNGVATIQPYPSSVYVYVNGILVSDENYAFIGNKLIFTTSLRTGDIVTVSGNNFVASQTLTSSTNDRVGMQFGYALDVTTTGNEILVGSPYEIDSENNEGQVYRFTNAASKFGLIAATRASAITTNSSILINGFIVNLSSGDTTSTVVDAINGARIPNVKAAAINDKLMIQTIDNDLAEINNKLVITALNSTIISELGIEIYTLTQVIKCPHAGGPTQFGKSIKFNNFDSVIIGAPVATRFEGTEFDFTDDENLHNDTVFDNNSTRFIDEVPGAGAVYLYDLLYDHDGSASRPGAFIYAQSVNRIDSISATPGYGVSLDFNDNNVVIGSPYYLPNIVSGQVSVFRNSIGEKNWAVYRQPSEIVDISKIQNTQLFNAVTNDTKVNLDYIDPLQGKLLGTVRQNIDYVSKIDPARYNSESSPLTGMSWGEDHVGEIWFNTESVRFVDYHQNDVVYNSKYWGTLFPGSDVAVYTWVESQTTPSNYVGTGIPYDVNLYSIGAKLNSSNIVTPVYYFWVRNTGIVDPRRNKTLPDTIISSYIADPKGSGIAYMAPVLPNTFAIYNSGSCLSAKETIFHIGFANGSSNDVIHNEYTLIRENFEEDFLPGLPIVVDTTYADALHGLRTASNTLEPSSLYARMLDSLSGCSVSGEVVPDPYLPLAVRSGVSVRPRQSFFYDRFEALKNYIQYANEILSLYPITELKPDLSFLFTSDEFHDTTNYWEYINWWSAGYSDSSRATLQVPIYADLSEINVAVGSLVKVEQNGAGFFEMYRFDGNGVWSRVGLENGTIRIKDSLWDYEASKIGFGSDFFDTLPFDSYPSLETRQIVRALNEQIYTEDLSSYRNKSLILLFEYIQSETTQSQNFLPWLSKTSLVDVSHSIRELKPYRVFKSDNEAFLEGYINEVKPYHVVIKDFLFNYTGTEDYVGSITDFDLPATWNNTYNKFITPQLTYGNPTTQFEYSATSDIWNSSSYTEWYNNYGLTLSGNPGEYVTRLASYMDTGSNYVHVENASGFPVTGTITIDQEEISYSYVDRELNVLGGVVRGINGTYIAPHLPMAKIYTDVPAVIVLETGKGYIDPPIVEAKIDTTKYPSPIEPVQLAAVMAGDKVIGVNVINPGKGYAVLPEIVISPAQEIAFDNSSINSTLHTINVYAPYLSTGDQVKFKTGNNGISPTKLVDGNWYYIGVLETTPSVIISLYTSLSDAIKDMNRVEIVANVNSESMTLLLGARAIAITSASPTRENNIKMRYDRTSYGSQVTDWREGAYYGAYFAGQYYNPNSVASSSYSLENTIPDINTILASAQGAVFEIADVSDDNIIDWSSYVRYVSSTVASGNLITLVPLDGNNPDLSELMPNASGTTVGMVTGMPIKFEGQVVGGLQENKIYYVSSIVSETEFTVSETVDGVPVTLTSASPVKSLLRCFTGETVGTTILSLNYPGILEVTETVNTQSSYNFIKIPLSPAGTGGTAGFYTELPVFFTGNVFGGVIENRTYYVTTVVDSQTVTLSEKMTPLTTTVTSSNSITDRITVGSTEGFSTNDPIIFTGTAIGNIVPGKTYYVRTVVNGVTMTISESINGNVMELLTATGSMLLTNQKDTINLTNATGSMTMNVSLPVSPGQINGQLFNIYETSGYYSDILPVGYGNLLSFVVTATIGTSNRIALSKGSDFSNVYVNMPIQLDYAIGGIPASTTYYVIEYSGRTVGASTIAPTKLNIVSTNSTGNRIVCDGTYDDTTCLYVGMPISFSGVGIGGLVIDQTYYVKTIVNSTSFTISDTLGGSTVSVASAIAANQIVATGEPYFKISSSIGGSSATLTTSVSSGSNIFTQTKTSTPKFVVSSILGGYYVSITNSGTGFAVNNTLTIPGNLIGGTTPNNDLVLTVNSIGPNGEITNVICDGKVATNSAKYYVQVRSPNTVALYKNAELTVSVPSSEFNLQGFNGFTSTVATSVSSATNRITVDSTAGFNINDAIVFTGTIFSESIILGKTYYILAFPTANTITISTVPGDALTQVTIASNKTGAMTMAKQGSFAFLPEPFHFNQSIVKFNNRLYVCVVSNNDKEFIIGKWELIDSDYPSLNAMDRAVAYYTPTVNMPGLDLTQLFDGTTFPYPTVKDNEFQPDKQYPIDTFVTDTAFTNSVVPQYTVKGTDFQYGYGPEELIPGKVTDNLAIMVSSRPGSNWPVVEYGNAGFNVAQYEIVPSQFQTVFDFNNVVETPANLVVQLIGSDGLATTIDPGTYQVNWVDKTFTLSNPVVSGNKLLVSVYEVGNGDQLVKANTDTDPIRIDAVSQFAEIFVNCAYSQDFYQGSGVINVGSVSTTTVATATNDLTNRIQCQSVDDFVLNKGITFQGVPFGGLSEDTVYYVKTISKATNTITVSLSTSGGVAGPTFDVTTATGSMLVNIENGSGVPWTTPFLYHNGTKLTIGTAGLITKTKGPPYNTIVTNTTSGLNPGDAITFCACAFGGVIVGLQKYYVAAIVDNNEFTISLTQGGPTLPLTDASGGSRFVSNDYAFGIQPDGISAKIVFPVSTYRNETDYIVYSLFGETRPDQLGYSVPEIQYFTGNGTAYQFLLTNYVGGNNPDVAIVEVNGSRLMTNQYTIDPVTNTITLGAIPAAGASISVTTFNDTMQQYLKTQTGLTGTVSKIKSINNVITAPITGFINQTSSTGNRITVSSSGGTTGFVPGQTVIFKGNGGSPFGGINTTGTVYFIDTVPDSTHFTIKNYAGTQITLTNATASLGNYLSIEVGNPPELSSLLESSGPTTRITTTTPHGFVDNNLIRIDDVSGSTQLNNNTYYVKYITPTVFDIYSLPYTSVQYADNNPITGVTTYVSGGYTWLAGSFFLSTTTATSTSAANNRITVTSTTGLKTGTPVYFSKTTTVNGTTLLGGVIQGTEYYVSDVIDATTLTISATRYGDTLALTSSSGTMNLTQWSQENVNRLWVTINGKRVPSSKLRLNPANELSILAAITPSDTIMVTNMIPTASPGEQIYLNLVNAQGDAIVYNSNAHTRTWLTQPLAIGDDLMHVFDVTRVINTVRETVIAPTPDAGFYHVGINVDKRLLSSVSIVNVTKNNTIISASNYEIELSSLSPEIKISSGSWINEGDQLIVTSLIGNTVFINGEQIQFTSIDIDNNTLSGLSRGANGTVAQQVIPEYIDVHGLTSANQLNPVYYDVVWNSYMYNPTLGDPLQISTTLPAIFLNTDIN